VTELTAQAAGILPGTLQKRNAGYNELILKGTSQAEVTQSTVAGDAQQSRGNLSVLPVLLRQLRISTIWS